MNTKFLQNIGYLALSCCVSTAYAAEAYVNAKIERIEYCQISENTPTFITLFLSPTSGTTPTSTDGCSNNGSYPYVQIAQSTADVENKKTLTSIALAAQTAGKQVRIRYDNAISNRVLSLAVIN